MSELDLQQLRRVWFAGRDNPDRFAPTLAHVKSSDLLSATESGDFAVASGAETILRIRDEGGI